MNETVLNVAIDQLLIDPTQPRKSFLKDEIDRLAASISARGLLQPLRVIFDAERQGWRVVTGECRYRAAKQAGLTHVPCLPVEGDPSEADILSDQVVENVARHALRPLELARSLAKLKALKRCSSQTLATELGLSGPAITRAEALLTLPLDVQAMVDDGRVPESSGYELSRLSDAAAIRELAGEIAARRITRDQVAAIVRESIGKKKSTTKTDRLPLKLGGIAVTVSAATPLTWETLLATLDQIRKEADKLKRNNQAITELAQSLRGG